MPSAQLNWEWSQSFENNLTSVVPVSTMAVSYKVSHRVIKNLEKLQKVADQGFKIGKPEFDWSLIMKRKEGIIDTQRRGLLFNEKQNRCFSRIRFLEDQHRPCSR